MITANRYRNTQLIKSEFEKSSEDQKKIIQRILFLHYFDRFINVSSTENLENLEKLIIQLKEV